MWKVKTSLERKKSVCIDDIAAVLSATDLRSLLPFIIWIDAPHTQNFEILKSLVKTKE
jgi:hypothetical protein